MSDAAVEHGKDFWDAISLSQGPENVILLLLLFYYFCPIMFLIGRMFHRSPRSGPDFTV